MSDKFISGREYLDYCEQYKIQELERELVKYKQENKELKAALGVAREWQENEELKAALGVAREWFDVVQDLNPDYLEQRDYVLAEKVYKSCGMKVPNSILKGKNLVK